MFRQTLAGEAVDVAGAGVSGRLETCVTVRPVHVRAPRPRNHSITFGKKVRIVKEGRIDDVTDAVRETRE